MGFRFDIEHANIVGWLTYHNFPNGVSRGWPDWPWWEPMHRQRLNRAGYEPARWTAPRIRADAATRFLEALSGPEILYAVATRHKETLDELRELANEALATFLEIGNSEPVLSPIDVAEIFGPLRKWFALPFYFLPVGNEPRFDDVAQSPEYTLWLLSGFGEGKPSDLLDPFPAIRMWLQRRKAEPTTVCWNWNGEPLVIPERKLPAEKLLSIVRQAPPWHLWDELSQFHAAEDPSLNIMQISDLHFGAKAVTTRKLDYVEQQLRSRIESTRRGGGKVQVVVTGDLMDSPSDKNLVTFESFRRRLAECSGNSVVCIPGNHDHRRKGFLSRSTEALSQLEWTRIAVCEDAQALFVCFDTSRDAKLAKGKITDDQFLEVATSLNEEAAKHPDYLRLVLVHHHPFSTQEDEIDTIPYLGIREEPFLRMEGGEHLVRWCVAQGIPLILHGHKHRPRISGHEVEHNGQLKWVRAIGSGATLGIEDKPLSYNWITWNPDKREWTVTFYADPGDGSGFSEKRLVIHNAV